MAIFHFSAQTIGRSNGRSATGAAAYRAGEQIVEQATGEVHDYTRKQGVLHSEILGPEGAPAWALDRSGLWNAVEKIEKRKDSQLCREINVALPAELDEAQRLELIREYVKQSFVRCGMVADLCLHAPSRTENNRNFHAHIMLTMRRLEGDGFGPKERSWNAVELLESWRKKWADTANSALEKAGFEDRIDHRSHADRGIEEMPGQHHGPAVSGILARGEHSDVVERQDGERAAREMAQLEAQITIARAQASAAVEELAAAQAEADAADAQARKERDAAQALAVAAAKAKAQAKAEAEAEAEAEVVAREQAAAAERAQALTQARAQHAAAQKDLAKAVYTEAQAEAEVDARRPAWADAVDGQRRAGTSLFATIQAAPKILGWTRAIEAYGNAMAALKSAQAAVQRVRQVVAGLWAQVLQLDPLERDRQTAAQAAQMEVRAQAQREEMEARAKREAERFTKLGQRPDRTVQKPLYEHSRQTDQDKDQERGS
jgi:hypothetical protein